MEVNPDLLEDMVNRKIKVLDLMDRVKSNSFVDTIKSFEFFVHVSPITDLYKYTWDLTILESHINDEMSTDTHWFKSFLEWYTNEDNTVRVYEVILSSLS